MPIYHAYRVVEDDSFDIFVLLNDVLKISFIESTLVLEGRLEDVIDDKLVIRLADQSEACISTSDIDSIEVVTYEN